MANNGGRPLFSSSLETAKTFAQSGRFEEMLAVCRQVAGGHCDQIDTLLDVGALLLHCGMLASAGEYFNQALALAPEDVRPLINLANVARDSGNHDECRHRYAELLARWPDHHIIRRNALVSLEYDPEIADAVRVREAKAWGDWAVGKAGGPRHRPLLRPQVNRPLRIGYVSADLCQHTVGLFVKDVLRMHDPDSHRTKKSKRKD